MRIPTPPNLIENPAVLMKTQKPKKYYNRQKRKGMSFFAFLLSIVFYISIFYIFSLSPSTLLGNTKFWFVISNTLILIIAADYGAFSSNSQQQDDHNHSKSVDVYEEYALHSQARRINTPVIAPPPPPPPQFVKTMNIHKEEETKKEDDDEIEDKKMIEIPERILEVDNFRAKRQLPENNPMIKVADHNETRDDHDQVIIKNKKIEPKTIRRSKSHKVKHVTFDEDRKNRATTALRRSNTTEKHDQDQEVLENEEFPKEENEFSAMSDEELNRRVEEFIQRFNMQIRLQESRA